MTEAEDDSNLSPIIEKEPQPIENLLENPPTSEQLEKKEILDLSSKTTIIGGGIISEPVYVYPNGPEAEGWRPAIGSVPEEPINVVHALGDLHGWAPGLITYLIHHQLAKIEITGTKLYSEDKDGISVNNEAMAHIFPHPIEYLEKNKHGQFEGGGLHGLPIEGGKWNYGISGIKAEWIGDKTNPSSCFIQVGDIIDRSDYSELSAEILRQLLIQAPLRVFVLLGNHEQFMLENDFHNWKFNEQKWEFTPDNLKKGTGFHTRFHEATHGWKHQDQNMHNQVFSMYQSSTAVLYLTQACVLAELGLYQLPESFDKSKILNGTFEAYQYAHEYLDKSLHEMSPPPKYFPGAFTSIGMGHSLFIHAEPSAFKEKSIDEVLTFIPIKNKKTEFIYSEYRQAKGEINASPDFDLLWKRNSSHGASSSPPVPACASYIQNLVGSLPGLRHYIHGHSPVTGTSWFTDLKGSSTVSYLAREPHLPLTRNKGNVRVHMIDEGICPVYFQGELDIFDPTRVPLGLQVHANALKFHSNIESLDVESLEKDWKHVLNSSENSKPFTIPGLLTLNKATNIGAFGPSSMILPETTAWSNSKKLHPSSSDLSSWRLLIDSDSPITSSLDFLLYPANEGLLNVPIRLPISTKDQLINIPLDQLLLDICQDASISQLTEKKPSQNTLANGKRWLGKILPEYVERLQEHSSLIENFGELCMMKTVGACYMKVIFSKNNLIQLLFLNGTETDLCWMMKPLPQNADVKENFIVIPKHSYHYEQFYAGGKKIGKRATHPIEFSIQPNVRRIDPIFKSLKEFDSDEKAGRVQRKITLNPAFCFIAWPKPNQTMSKNKKSIGKLPKWEFKSSITDNGVNNVADNDKQNTISPISSSKREKSSNNSKNLNAPPPPPSANTYPEHEQSSPIHNINHNTGSSKRSNQSPIRSTQQPRARQDGGVPFNPNTNPNNNIGSSKWGSEEKPSKNDSKANKHNLAPKTPPRGKILGRIINTIENLASDLMLSLDSLNPMPMDILVHHFPHEGVILNCDVALNIGNEYTPPVNLKVKLSDTEPRTLIQYQIDNETLKFSATFKQDKNNQISISCKSKSGEGNWRIRYQKNGEKGTMLKFGPQKDDDRWKGIELTLDSVVYYNK